MENSVLENMMTRASVRKFKNQPVEKEKIDALLHAAMSAPSAVNKQPWHFVVVTSSSVQENINQYRSPLSIVVCWDMEKTVQMGKEWIFRDGLLASEKYTSCRTCPGSWRNLDSRIPRDTYHAESEHRHIAARQHDTSQCDTDRLSGW